MRKIHWVALVGAMIVVQPAQAALIGGFELNGTTANSVANGVTLTNNGGTLGATGIAFAFNGGPTVSGIGALANYTIDIGFTLEAVSGYRKLIDFSNRASDAGYYNLNGSLVAFPLPIGSATVFAANTPVRLTLSRTSAGLITGYIDGVQIFSAMDAANNSQTAINGLNPLHFFRDDFQVPNEASPGFVDYIRIFDTAITPGEAEPQPGAVPEPATWAMMLLGFGAMGASLRRRAKVSARVRFA